MLHSEAPAYSFGTSKRILTTEDPNHVGKPVMNRSHSQKHRPIPSISSKLKVLKQAPSWTIGKSPRYGEEAFQYPSPASYTPRGSTSARGYSVGYSKRDPWAIMPCKDVPGPGSYESPKKTERFAYTIPKTEDPTAQLTPGPSTYRPSTSNLNCAPRATIGSSKRLKGYKGFTPGVGSYNLRLKKSHTGFSIGRESRYGVAKKKEVGPGSYNIPSVIGKKELLKN